MVIFVAPVATAIQKSSGLFLARLQPSYKILYKLL